MSGTDDVDLDEMMAAMGVRSYDPAKGERRPKAAPVTATPARPLPPPPVVAPPSPPPLPTPDPLHAELARVMKEVALMRAELEEAQARVVTLTRERDGVDDARRRATDELREIRAELDAAVASVPLEQVLSDRGLSGHDEHLEVLRRLLELRPDELIDSVQVHDSVPVRSLLDQRVALVCSKESCQPDGPGVVLRVPPGRCEVCGGSDTRAAWSRFVAACEGEAVRRLVFVGGSPAYRKQLRSLAEGGSLKVEFVPGSVRRPKPKADADMRRADLVVIWGSTILDHSISENYRSDAGPARLVPVNIRGISRMLDAVRRAVLGV